MRPHTIEMAGLGRQDIRAGVASQSVLHRGPAEYRL